MKLIFFEELIATPWKNGGGVTRELVCHPAGAAFDDFLWRISIADVSRSGPFSVFPGIDRSITLLEGGGMHLNFPDGERHALTEPLTPYRFRGEQNVDAQLVDTPSQDFNLMLRRGAVDGAVQVRREAGDVDCGQGHMTFFCARGSWEIFTHDGSRHNLQTRQTLTGECAPGTMRIRPLQAGSALLCVSVRSCLAMRPSTGIKHAH